MAELLVLLDDVGKVITHVFYRGGWGRGFSPANEELIIFGPFSRKAEIGALALFVEERLVCVTRDLDDRSPVSKGGTYEFPPGGLTFQFGNGLGLADMEWARSRGFDPAALTPPRALEAARD